MTTLAQLSREQAFCVALLPEVSRTFALSIEALPGSLRDAVRTAYLLCRIVDTIEDEADLPMAVRGPLFDLFDDAMADDTGDILAFDAACATHHLGGDGPDGQLCRGASNVFAIFRALSPTQREAIRPSVLEMSRGMREYAQRAADSGGPLRLTDMDDLERYCYFVAGTVGELLTALFELAAGPLDADRLAAVRERAVSFGLGLQMVNIVKDVATDLERDVCFLPQSLAHARGLTLESLLEPKNRGLGLEIVHEVCERARLHLIRAQEYTLLWPVPAGVPVRLFCAVPLALALATLNEVEVSDDTLRRGRVPKISRETVAHVLTDARDAVRDNIGLDALFGQYRGGSVLAAVHSPG